LPCTVLSISILKKKKLNSTKKEKTPLTLKISMTKQIAVKARKSYDLQHKYIINSIIRGIVKLSPTSLKIKVLKIKVSSHYPDVSPAATIPPVDESLIVAVAWITSRMLCSVTIKVSPLLTVPKISSSTKN